MSLQTHGFRDTQSIFGIVLLFFFRKEGIRLIFTYLSLHDDTFIKLKQIERNVYWKNTSTKDPKINLLSFIWNQVSRGSTERDKH